VLSHAGVLLLQAPGPLREIAVERRDPVGREILVERDEQRVVAPGLLEVGQVPNAKRLRIMSSDASRPPKSSCTCSSSPHHNGDSAAKTSGDQ
jgi:hypothetical protein